MIQEIPDSPTLNKDTLSSLLERYRHAFHPVMQWPSIAEQLVLFDFTAANTALKKINLEDTALFQQQLQTLLDSRKASMGVGGYLENRVIYHRSSVFEGNENRCIHLGVDIWAPAFSQVFAPLEGRIHSFQDNNAFGDYGPTIILEHLLEGTVFYSLYGHLSRRSLTGLKAGQQIKKGEAFTELGPFPENGNWPPHLHFQVIANLEGRHGDFPGVAAPSEQEKYRQLCPNPNLMLNLPQLETA